MIPVFNVAWYFDGSRRWLKFLRFLNLLEPDRPVLDITKLMAWASFFQSVLLVGLGSSSAVTGPSLGLTLITAIKHEWRRKQQNEASNAQPK